MFYKFLCMPHFLVLNDKLYRHCTNKKIWHFVSLVNTVNNIGETTHPCGVPVLTHFIYDTVFSHLTDCCLFEKKITYPLQLIDVYLHTVIQLFNKHVWYNSIKCRRKISKNNSSINVRFSRWPSIVCIKNAHASSVPLIYFPCTQIEEDQERHQFPFKEYFWLPSQNMHYMMTGVSAINLNSFSSIGLLILGKSENCRLP